MKKVSKVLYLSFAHIIKLLFWYKFYYRLITPHIAYFLSPVALFFFYFISTLLMLKLPY